MKAPEILRHAADLIAERGRQRDRPGGERSMAAAVREFNAATGLSLTEAQGWHFMQCLKRARGPLSDDMLDRVAYAALEVETLLSERQAPRCIGKPARYRKGGGHADRVEDSPLAATEAPEDRG